MEALEVSIEVGDRGGNSTGSTPLSSRMLRKAAENFVSRSMST